MAQHRVQNYLDRHSIGNMFKDMMSKLVQDMPDDPVLYLVKWLQKKHKKESALSSTMPVRKSTSDIAGSKHPSGGGLSKSLSATMPSSPAAAWAKNAEENLTGPKDREYEKPWKSNSRRLKSKKSVEHKLDTGDNTKPEKKPDWNADKKVPASNFDELWEITQSVKDTKLDDGDMQTKPKKTWLRSDLGDVDELTYTSSGYTGPVQKSQPLDDLEEELMLGKIQHKRHKDNEEENKKQLVTFKKKGHKADAAKHRQELEKIILEQKACDSGYHDEPITEEYDGAIDVLENEDDLRNEGVQTISSTGHKLSKTYNVAESPAVHVTLCPRCARVLTAKPSEPGIIGTPYGQLSNSEQYDTESDRTKKAGVKFASSSSSSSELDEEDEEFESVSQISGPRHPVWQEVESETEAMTQRKGAHMFARQGSPNKGMPMYGHKSPTDMHIRSNSPRSDVSTLVGSVVGDQLSSPSVKHESINRQKPRQTDTQQSVNTEDEDPLKQLPRRSWQLAEDSDVGSSVDWTRKRDAASKKLKTKDKTVY